MGGNTDGPDGADIGDMTPDSVSAGAKPTARAGAPLRHVPLRPDAYRADAGRGDGSPGSPWAESEPEWEPWPFPDEEPAEGENDGPVFVDHSGRRRRLAVLIGSSAAVVIVVALVILATGLSGVAPLSVPGFPDLGRPAPAPVVAPSPDPAQREPGNAPTAASGAALSPTPSRTSPRHIPTQTPPHPTKTK